MCHTFGFALVYDYVAKKPIQLSTVIKVLMPYLHKMPKTNTQKVDTSITDMLVFTFLAHSM